MDIHFWNCSEICIFDDAFSGLSSLVSLRIEQCDITLPPKIQEACKNLKNLHLQHNNIRFIPNDYFKGCARIEFLNLEHNEIMHMPNIQDLGGSLLYLFLSHNAISTLDVKDTMKIDMKIDTLSMGYNSLISMDLKRLLEKCPRIQLVHVNHNNITEIPNLAQMHIGGEERLIYIAANSNPFRSVRNGSMSLNQMCKTNPPTLL